MDAEGCFVPVVQRQLANLYVVDFEMFVVTDDYIVAAAQEGDRFVSHLLVLDRRTLATVHDLVLPHHVRDLGLRRRIWRPSTVNNHVIMIYDNDQQVFNAELGEYVERLVREHPRPELAVRGKVCVVYERKIGGGWAQGSLINGADVYPVTVVVAPDELDMDALHCILDDYFLSFDTDTGHVAVYDLAGQKYDFDAASRELIKFGGFVNACTYPRGKNQIVVAMRPRPYSAVQRVAIYRVERVRRRMLRLVRMCTQELVGMGRLVIACDADGGIAIAGDRRIGYYVPVAWKIAEDTTRGAFMRAVLGSVRAAEAEGAFDPPTLGGGRRKRSPSRRRKTPRR